MRNLNGNFKYRWNILYRQVKFLFSLAIMVELPELLSCPILRSIFWHVRNINLFLLNYFYIMNNQTGKYIIIAGIVIILAGLLIYFFADKLNWVGRLPGDIRIEKENFRFYFPITTMILVSLLIALVVQIIKRW